MWKTASLTPEIRRIVIDKGTEAPYSGQYNSLEVPGTYLCRQCGLALFRGDCKFVSSCGWPSYDAQVLDHIKKQPDVDGIREEILCKRCDAHLGHVFYGEGLTEKDTRYCVNSLSLDFVKSDDVIDTEEVILAAGCFWGVEYLFQQLEGVLKTEVGYSGGQQQDPAYQDVCRGTTGHYEVVRIIYDKNKTDLEKILKFFFEIHNFEQNNGQGPDIGHQYLSVIFYYDSAQQQMALELRQALREKGYQPSTQILPVKIFWLAEADHQDYYIKHQKQPYCHQYRKIF